VDVSAKPGSAPSAQRRRAALGAASSKPSAAGPGRASQRADRSARPGPGGGGGSAEAEAKGGGEGGGEVGMDGGGSGG